MLNCRKDNKLGIIIAAGGSGKRFGSIYKPLLKIEGKSILEIVIGKFLHLKNVEKIVISVPNKYIKKIEDVIYSAFHHIFSTFSIVRGGEERKFSVYNAYKVLSHHKNINIIIIHDAARPIFDIKLLNLMLKKVSHSNAVIPVRSIPDTVKLIENNRVKNTLDRSNLYLSLTPQVFKKNILEYAYNKINISKYMITDEAQLLEMVGKRVNAIVSSDYNIKITYPTDYAIVKYLLTNNKYCDKEFRNCINAVTF